MARTLIRAQTQINNTSDLAGEDGYFLRSNGSIPLAGNLDADSNKITNLADPTAAQDAASKSYVDGVAQGLSLIQPVRASTTAALVDNGWTASGSKVGKTLTSPSDAVSNNDFDGVTLSAGDRLLVKDEAAGDLTHNGVYELTTAADGAGQNAILTRATDFDEDSEVVAGSFVFVEEGTANSDNGYVVSSNDPITVDTDDIEWQQFSGAGQIVAGDGLTKTGSTIDFNATDASLTVNADDAQVAFDSTASTIALGDDGIKVADATAGSILIGQGTGTETAFIAVGGDITSLDASGNFTIAAAGSVIESTGSGIRLSQTTAGQFLIAQGASSDTTYQTLGGDVSSVDATGSVTLASAILREGDIVIRETPTGAIDNSNQTFTLANTPVSGTEEVFFNGQLLVEGGTEDYTISGNTISLNFSPKPSPGNPDVLRANYIYQSV